MPQLWQLLKLYNSISTIPDGFRKRIALQSSGVIFLKRIWKDILKSAVIGFLMPGALLLAVVCNGKSVNGTDTSIAAQAQVPPEASTGETQKPLELYISVLDKGSVKRMPLEEYVVGVVLAEVPASFSMEALKAQAVASRTYALSACEGAYHGESDICTSHTCCQAYCSPEQYLASGGSEENLQKIRYAVESTKSQVLTYLGQLICATYFSCSGGSTEDAVAVWGTDIPYLQSVESPGEEFAEVFTDTCQFTPEAFQTALGVQLAGPPENWFGNVIYTEGGGVGSMMIGGISFKGTTLRTLLGLRSTVFTVSVTDGMIRVDTQGYGHRVGMSQYGAEAMAQAGCDYTQILQHYYLGTTIEEYPL